MLQRYTSKAKTMSDAELLYALRDVQETIPLHDYGTDYSNKLYAEFDAYTVEITRRRNGKRN